MGIVIFCAIPHRPGIDNIDHAEWGFDYEKHSEVQNDYGEERGRKDFTDKIKPFLPEDYEQRFIWPQDHSSRAISLDLKKEDFSEEHWEEVLLLIREQWPKTTTALAI